MIKVRFLRSCRVCERGTLATFGKERVYPKTVTLYFPGRCHVQGRAGEARNHATWIRKSRYARFRASSARDVDEDALETLTQREQLLQRPVASAGSTRLSSLQFHCVLPRYRSVDCRLCRCNASQLASW